MSSQNLNYHCHNKGSLIQFLKLQMSLNPKVSSNLDFTDLLESYLFFLRKLENHNHVL